jgi:hypothetical protein
VKWRFSVLAGDVEESKLCLFSVIMPAKCVSSISPRFHYRRLAFCFLPLAAILEFSSIHYILEGLRQAKIKPLNFSQVMVVQQGPLKTPVAFFQRLKYVLQRHTNFGTITRVTGAGDCPKR